MIFTLGNSSDAFLMLRAQTLGFQPAELFVALAAFSLVVTLSSTPGGASRTGLDGAASLSRIGLFMR